MEATGPLDEEEVRALDERYRPFAPVAAWSGVRLAGDVWDDALAHLAAARNAATPTTFAALLARTVRQAAIDTGAIEGLYDTDRGFTITVAAMATAWAAAIEEQKGKDVARLVGAQAEGYELALDAATSRTPLSEAWLRRLHEVICDPQDGYLVATPLGPQRHTLPKGEYKSSPNHVVLPDGTSHSYAPVADTAAEVRRLVVELRSDAFERSHPAVQAAYAHHALTSIHPFSDGNGRVARAVASVFLARATSVPLVLFADQRADYLLALRAADRGGVQRLAGFIFDRGLDTVLLAEQELRDAGKDDALRIQTARLQAPAVLRTRGAELLWQLFGELELGPSPKGERAGMGTSPRDEPAGWHRPPPRYFEGLSLHTLGTEARAQGGVAGLLSTDPTAYFAFALEWSQDGDNLPFRLDEVHPVVTEAAIARMRPWLRRHLIELIEQLDTEVHRS